MRQEKNNAQSTVNELKSQINELQKELKVYRNQAADLMNE